uniref:Tandem C2 domains, nuclear n=1 Tax=Oryzias latipes TaxID=8090 RepID=A0A3B3IFH5_ORYLA
MHVHQHIWWSWFCWCEGSPEKPADELWCGFLQWEHRCCELCVFGGEENGHRSRGDEKRRADTDDYLLSKMPPNGREVPFVVPTLVQPRVKPPSPASQPTHHRMYLRHRCRESGSHPRRRFTVVFASNLFPEVEPKLESRRSPPTLLLSVRKGLCPAELPGGPGAGVDHPDSGKVTCSMEGGAQGHKAWLCSPAASVNAPLCVQRKRLYGAEEQKVGFKGFITVPKPIQFKSCIRDYSQVRLFMQSFVFALRLEQLRSCALVLRLQVHAPRKRTVAESVLSLRRLGPKESEYWLDLNPPSKSPACHSELHLSTCFQPVNGRVQLQVLAAQSLPPTSSPLSLRFFVTAEMQQAGRKDTRKKCRAVKALEGQCRWGETFHFLLASLEEPCSLSVRLYSYSSVRRKCCLGQVRSPVPEAVEQWTDTMTHPEKVVTAWLRLSPP